MFGFWVFGKTGFGATDTEGTLHEAAGSIVCQATSAAAGRRFVSGRCAVSAAGSVTAGGTRKCRSSGAIMSSATASAAAARLKTGAGSAHSQAVVFSAVGLRYCYGKGVATASGSLAGRATRTVTSGSLVGVSATVVVTSAVFSGAPLLGASAVAVRSVVRGMLSTSRKGEGRQIYTRVKVAAYQPKIAVGSRTVHYSYSWPYYRVTLADGAAKSTVNWEHNQPTYVISYDVNNDVTCMDAKAAMRAAAKLWLAGAPISQIALKYPSV